MVEKKKNSGSKSPASRKKPPRTPANEAAAPAAPATGAQKTVNAVKNPAKKPAEEKETIIKAAEAGGLPEVTGPTSVMAVQQDSEGPARPKTRKGQTPPDRQESMEITPDPVQPDAHIPAESLSEVSEEPRAEAIQADSVQPGGSSDEERARLKAELRRELNEIKAMMARWPFIG